jgi:AraC-like DNA-binding protein
MKKFLLSFAVVALVFGGLFACGEQTKWNREERQAMRNLLRDSRKMVYLNDLSEAEYMLFSTEGVPPLENLFENLCYTLVGRDNLSADVVKATVGLILRHFAELPDCMITAARHRSGAELLQARIESYIRTDFRTATLSELADRLGLSVPYLSKRVRELCGATFSQLLQEARFVEAIRLLEETDLPVGDIIIAVGYENTSFFHNQFRERYHCSPFRWRKNRKEEENQ